MPIELGIACKGLVRLDGEERLYVVHFDLGGLVSVGDLTVGPDGLVVSGGFVMMMVARGDVRSAMSWMMRMRRTRRRMMRMVYRMTLFLICVGEEAVVNTECNAMIDGWNIAR